MDEKFEEIIKKCQKYLENIPTIIIGSGFSVPFGLPSMWVLGEEIKAKLNTKYFGDEVWKSFVSFLDSTENLELAMHKAPLTPEMFLDIINVTWELINAKDKDVFMELMHKTEGTVLSQMFYKLLQSHPRKVKVITANYDRLVEYSVDKIPANIEIGFHGECTKNFIGLLKSHEVKENTVLLCKVHGSLDWFRSKRNLQLVSMPNSFSIYDGFTPAIVTPGIQKYQETHNEPYRSLIATADEFISSASSFLCIGYGFNDEHLQPKLIEHIQQRNKPAVIVTKTLSDKGKEILENAKKFIVFEEESGGKTRITVDGVVEVVDGDYWQLDQFIKLWL